MITRVSEQASRLSTSGKTFKDNREKKADQKAAEEKAGEEKRAKIAGASQRQTGATSTKATFAIFGNVSAFRQIRTFTAETFEHSLSNNMPVIIKHPMEAQVVETILKHDEFINFKKSADTNTRYKVTGRVAQQMTFGRAPTFKYVYEFLNPGRQNVMRHISESEKAYCSAPWMFLCSGRLKSRGVEFSYLPSLKYQLEGARVAICACYSELTEFYKTTLAPSATVTYDDVMDFFASVVFQNKTRKQTKITGPPQSSVEVPLHSQRLLRQDCSR